MIKQNARQARAKRERRALLCHEGRMIDVGNPYVIIRARGKGRLKMKRLIIYDVPAECVAKVTNADEDTSVILPPTARKFLQNSA